MENLIKVGDAINAVETMTSVEIAQVTGKQHSHVMRDIRNLSIQLNENNESTLGLVDFSEDYHRGDRTQYKFLSDKTQKSILDFAFGEKTKNVTNYVITESLYTDKKGEKRSMFVLNKKACFLLASGYNVVLRAKIIDRWEELEKEKANAFKVPTTFKEALQLAVAQQEQIEMQQAQLLEMNEALMDAQPKADYLDVILQNKETVTVTQIAQDYGMSAKQFNKVLRTLDIQHRVADQWILYAKYLKEGYVHSETIDVSPQKNGDKIRQFTKWTQKGRLFLYNKLKENKIIPLIDKK